MLPYFLGSSMAAPFHHIQLFPPPASSGTLDDVCFAMVRTSRTGKFVSAQVLEARDFVVFAHAMSHVSNGGQVFRRLPKTGSFPSAERKDSLCEIYLLRWFLSASAKTEFIPISAIDGKVELPLVYRACFITPMECEPALFSFAGQSLAYETAFEFRRHISLEDLPAEIDIAERYFFQASRLAYRGSQSYETIV